MNGGIVPRILFLVAILALACISIAAETEAADTTLSIKGLTCEGCEARLERKLQQISGVLEYEVHRERAEAEVRYDPDKTDAGAIAESLLKAGFEVVLALWEPVDASFDGCSNGFCGTRIPNAKVSPQPGAVPGQKVYCPVSGVVLGITDRTPRGKVNGEPVYVCCAGCARYLRANKDRVLALRGLGGHASAKR